MSIKNRYVGLAGLVFLAGYLVFASWFPFKAGYDQLPLPDIYRFTPTGLAAAAYALWLLALFGLLWWLYRLVRSGQLAPTWFWLLAGAALFCLPLVFSFPINATDLYRYYLSGRVTAHYGASPFSTPPGVFEAAPYFDEFMALGGEWRTVTTPYGPLWELLAAAVAGLCGDNLHLALVVFKSLGALCHLAAGALIWLLLRPAAPAERLGRTLLWLWNPALLLILVVDAHNDGLMIVWLLLGAWLLQRARQRQHRVAARVVALLVMALAVLSKPIALLPLPLFYVASMRELPSWRPRLQLLLLGSLGSLALVVAVFAPFALLDASSSGVLLSPFRRLLDEAAGSGGFSLTTLVALLLNSLRVPIRPPALVRGAALLFLLFTVWQLWRVWRGRPAWRAAAEVITGYLLQAFKYRIWYAGWVFPWLLLDTAAGIVPLAIGYAFLLTSQLSVLIYGHLYRWSILPNYVWAHLIGVPFVFGLPLLAGRLAGSRRRRPVSP